MKNLNIDELLPLILWHESYYDGPLSGVCRIDGKNYRFNCKVMPFWEVYEEEGDGSNDILNPGEYELTLMTRWQYIKNYTKHAWFRFCVGNHTDYNNGKRPSTYPRNRPKWLNKILHDFYFRKSLKK